MISEQVIVIILRTPIWIALGTTQNYENFFKMFFMLKKKTNSDKIKAVSANERIFAGEVLYIFIYLNLID